MALHSSARRTGAALVGAAVGGNGYLGDRARLSCAHYALHRVRPRLVGERTGIINQIRAFLLERGIAVRQGLRFLRTELPSRPK
jgi:hypothetical protein